MSLIVFQLFCRTILMGGVILGIFAWMDVHEIDETTQRILAGPIGIALGVAMVGGWEF